MPRTHYETLGVARTATAQEIRSAYRKIVLKHHPDRSSEPASKTIFLNATEAYDVLNDEDRRKLYDQSLMIAEQAKRQASTQKQSSTQQRTSTQSQPPPQKNQSGQRRPPPNVSPVTVELSRLTLLYNRGQFAEAERVARSILTKDPRQAIPYAVLGDIARSRGQIDEAQRMYAYAAQMDPRNPVYQRRYEQLLASSHIDTSGKRARLEAEQQVPALAGIAGGVSVASAMYIALSGETAVLAPFGLVSTWTLGLLILLFLCGVVAGACLSIGNLIDRFEAAATTATGRSGPTVVLGLIAIVNFWAAASVYVLIGLVQRAFNYSTTRIVAATAIVVLLLTMGAQMGGSIDPRQVLLWGGNLTYLGTLVGWLVADAFKS